MASFRIIICTFLALLAFAANSIITRAALENTNIDETSFILLRIVAGAVFLALYVVLKKQYKITQSGSWIAALALFIYAITFTYGYALIAAGTGALILFGSVQITMTFAAYRAGERLNKVQMLGFILAFLGVVILMFPGLAAPSFIGTLLMCLSGIAWGVYTLKGRGVNNPSVATAGNFIKASPLAIVLWLGVKLLTENNIVLDAMGVFYAILSGSITSGLGYILWYSVLPELKATQAAVLQLSVPLIVTLAGALLLSEAVTPPVIIASIAIITGTVLVLKFKSQQTITK